MKVLIELDDDVFNDIRESGFDSARAIVRNFQATITDAIRNGTPISDNATNGDMIKAIFPNAKIDINEMLGVSGIVFVDSENEIIPISQDWRNAPYKGI